jgi:predicted O-methyltransferase YrrM
MSKLAWKLRDLKAFDAMYRLLRNTLQGRGWGAFHRDRVYRAMMLDLLEAMPITSFVETGTYRGYSTELIATRHPQLPVFTSEVVPATFDRARRALAGYRNVTPMLGSSEACVKELLEGNKLGTLPLLYLDAHWERYWPLRDELRLIGAGRRRAVIVIDDFEVPGQEHFGYDVDGGGVVQAGKKCNLEYIASALSGEQNYQVVFPKYSAQAAFGGGGRGLLRGHVILFQNLADECEAFLHRPLAREHYFGYGAVSPKVNESNGQSEARQGSAP